jgi:predicted glycosyltransferase
MSCGTNNQQEENEGYQFYYYPQKNVYYEVEKKLFYYSLNGGKSWDSITSILNDEPATLGEKVIIYSADNNVYKDNAAHRKLYNGRLFNIVDPDTSFAAAVPEVSERKVQKKRTPEVKPEEEPIRGLKKFLNKLFGKHHKKKEDD